MGSSVEQHRDEIRRLSRPKVIRQIFNSDLPTFWFESTAVIAVGHHQKKLAVSGDARGRLVPRPRNSPPRSGTRKSSETPAKRPKRGSLATSATSDQAIVRDYVPTGRRHAGVEWDATDIPSLWDECARRRSAFVSHSIVKGIPIRDWLPRRGSMSLAMHAFPPRSSARRDEMSFSTHSRRSKFGSLATSATGTSL